MPVIVTGMIKGEEVNNTIRDGTNSKPYHLGMGVSEEEIVVVLGSNKRLKGIDYGTLGAAFIFLNNTIVKEKEGIVVGEYRYLKVMNTLNRENYIEAHYESSAGRKK